MLSISRVGFALAVACVVLLGATALRAERVVGDAGQPWLTFGVDVPSDAARLGDIEATWRRRLRTFHLKVGLGERTREDALGLKVEVMGAGPADILRVERALSSSAQVQLRPVVSESMTATAWFTAYSRGEVQLPAGAAVVTDSWEGPRGRVYVDSYLKAPDRATMDKAIGELAIVEPIYDDVLLEEVRPPQGAPAEMRPYLRTYFVSRQVVISNDDFVNAQITYDPNTLQPEVAVELSSAGGARFGDYTAEHLGEKLAIVLDGDVVSAPILMGAIRGGRITITMGGASQEEQLALAQTIVGALGGGGRLPPGIQARHLATHAGSMGVVWAVRGMLALLAGALGFFVPVVLARRRWFAFAPSVVPTDDARRWDAMLIPIGVTLVLPTLLWFAARELWLPGVNSVEIENIFARGGTSSDVSSFGIFALGISPVLSAFVLVELAAAGIGLALPAWRDRRLGTPAERRRLDHAVWLLVPVLAAVQGYFVAQYFDSLNSGGAAIFSIDRGIVPLIVVTLMAGVMVHVVVAELISRHGLCNGYLLLAAVGVLPLIGALLDPPTPQFPPPSDLPSTTLRLAVLAAVALATFAIVRLRSVSLDDEDRSGPRLPYTGNVPTEMIRTGFALMALPALWSPWVAEQLYELQDRSSLFELAAVVPLAALILFTSKQPWSRAGVIATFLFLGLLALLPYATEKPYRMLLPITQGVTLGIVVAELVAGFHARIALARPVTVFLVHDVFRGDAAADRLDSAGIPHAVLGIRARAALRLLGAYVPVEIRVPADRADEARALLADA